MWVQSTTQAPPQARAERQADRRAGQMSRRLLTSTAVVCAALALSAVFVGTALANRSFENRIRGFDGISATTTDAHDNVWVADGGQGSKENPGNEGLYKYA